MVEKPRVLLPAERRLQSNPDGTLKNGNAEQFALMVGDGVAIPVAWKVLGHKNDGSSVRYRRAQLTDAAFKRRVSEVQMDKEKTLAGGPWGDAEWSAKMCWATARAQNDLARMENAAKMLLQVANLKIGRGGDPAPTPAENKVGKPITESPQSISNAATAHAKLLGLGIAAPVPVAAE